MRKPGSLLRHKPRLVFWGKFGGTVMQPYVMAL
jgi:hypothetical protein